MCKLDPASVIYRVRLVLHVSPIHNLFVQLVQLQWCTFQLPFLCDCVPAAVSLGSESPT